MAKEDVLCLYNGILLGNKKERNNTICSNVDGPRDYHTKQSKSDRERQRSNDIAYRWNLLKKMIQMNLKTDSETENKLMATKAERGGA